MPALSDFLGTWRLSRRIAAPDGTETGRVEGVVVFSEGEGGLIVEERGRMRLAGGPEMVAERRLIWRPEGAWIAVYFADGRAFHVFDPTEAHSEARHDCPPDLYEVAYDFSRFPAWCSTWRVTGPRKNYVMTSSHSRRLA